MTSLAELSAARALFAGKLPAAQRASLLRALAIVYGEIDRARAARLQAAFAGDPYAVDEAALRALGLAQELRLAAHLDDGDRSAGQRWVLERSVDVLRLVAAVLGEPPPPGGGDGVLDERGADAAAATVEALEDILIAVARGQTAPQWTARALNPNAGMHAIPADLREVAAALHAGEETCGRFAYYAARYGERGRAFIRSDAAWLATLARADAAHATTQVAWLARVLASRGMPRLLMEVHLDDLERALVASLPERAAAYTALPAAARELRGERTRAIPEARAHELVAGFARGRDAEAGMTAREAATLLVAAVADELAGVANAVRGIAPWFSDGARFSAGWREAVAALLQAARS